MYNSAKSNAGQKTLVSEERMFASLSQDLATPKENHLESP